MINLNPIYYFNPVTQDTFNFFVFNHKFMSLRIAEFNLKLKLNKHNLGFRLFSLLSAASLTVVAVALVVVLWDKLANRSLWPPPLAVLLESQL